VDSIFVDVASDQPIIRGRHVRQAGHSEILRTKLVQISEGALNVATMSAQFVGTEIAPTGRDLTIESPGAHSFQTLDIGGGAAPCE
jgi:hypothetical protein